MASITYNNLSAPSGIVTFTEIPNILKVKEYSNGTKATFTFTFHEGLRGTVTGDSQYYVTFLGETVTNVMMPSKAINKRFFIASNAVGTAASFAKALRNCGSINAEFNIIHNGTDVVLIGKTDGQKWTNIPNYIQRNISNAFLSTSGVDGTSDSPFKNGKITLDIYNSKTLDMTQYVTTLEKNFYGDECAFDVSPVLATFSEYGTTKPYYFNLGLITESGEYQSVGALSGSTAIGYHANQSKRYLIAEGVQMLLNTDRGDDGILLYTYDPKIEFSVLVGSGQSGFGVRYTVLDSAYNVLYEYQDTYPHSEFYHSPIRDLEWTIPTRYYNAAYYVDVTLSQVSYRFNLIKPLKATQANQRVYWRNEYGGIQFFDFTSSHNESDTVDIETYEKNVFDYYETSAFERKKIYKNDYKKSVTLTSHLMKEDGKWVFNSLMRSKKVWTTVNGKMYYIIPKTIEVTEDQTYDGVFTAKLNFEFSDI